MRTKTLWLNILPTLDAILNSNSLTEAAEAAHLTQPALSIALRKARDHFEDELVVFSNTGSHLTEFGVELRPRVKAALQTARDALDFHLEFDPSTSSRHVRIMANSYLELAFIPIFLEQLYSEAPNLTVTVEPFRPLPKNPNHLDEFDIIVASSSFVSDSYNHVEIFSDELKGLVWCENSKVGDAISMSEWFQLSHASAASIKTDTPIVSNIDRIKRVGLYAASANALPYMIVGTELVIMGLSKYCDIFTRQLPLRTVDLMEDESSLGDSEINISVYWKPHRDKEPFILWLIDKCRHAGRLYSGSC